MQYNDTMTDATDRKWFHEARFGMFLHWGLYALSGRGEWDMYQSRTPLREYDGLAAQFNPEKFDAREWARIAAGAGMRYMVFTARHHDGFCLYDSQVSDFTSVKCSPQRRDYVAEYVTACREQGLKVGLYYSLMDWRFPGYFNYTSDPESAAAMRRQCHEQVRELLTHYGKIDLLWYDGLWLNHDAETDRSGYCATFWRAQELEAMARALQPGLLINNSSGVPADFSTPEGRVLPPEEKDRAWEACMTMGAAWGYVADPDPMLLTVPQLVKNLFDCAKDAGNYLLNGAVKPDGSIAGDAQRALRAIGAWLKVNGKAIYDSERLPLPRTDLIAGWTQAGGRCYGLLFALPACGELVLPLMAAKPKSVRLLGSGTKLKISHASNGRVVVSGFPKRVPVKPFPVLELEFGGEPRIIDESTNRAAWLDGTLPAPA
jgi:alpha-L-fucosidase